MRDLLLKASLVAIAVAVLSAFTAGLFAQSVGDCTGSKNSGNNSLICGSVQNCTPTGCQSFDFECGSILCDAYVGSNIQQVGTCQAGNSSCFFCSKYYCVTANIYLYVDSNGQCQNQTCTQVLYSKNTCIPPGKG